MVTYLTEMQTRFKEDLLYGWYDTEKMTGLSSAIIAKLSKEEESIMLDLVDRIAIALDVRIAYVIGIINHEGIG